MYSHTFVTVNVKKRMGKEKYYKLFIYFQENLPSVVLLLVCLVSVLHFIFAWHLHLWKYICSLGQMVPSFYVQIKIGRIGPDICFLFKCSAVDFFFLKISSRIWTASYSLVCYAGKSRVHIAVFQLDCTRLYLIKSQRYSLFLFYPTKLS